MTENRTRKAQAEAAAADLESLVQHWTAVFESAGLESAELKPAPRKWSVKEILGHLTDSAGNNLQRFVRSQELKNGEELVLPGYGADHWVDSQNYQSMEWTRAFRLWESANLHVAHVMKQIPEEKLAAMTRIGSYEPANILWLVTDYVDHQKHHLKKIAEQLGITQV